MVDLSDFLEDEDEGQADEEAQDLVALKACLKALADAVASTNLAVLNTAQSDLAAASARVQASVAALKRFHEGYLVLDGQAAPAEPDAAET